MPPRAAYYLARLLVNLPPGGVAIGDLDDPWRAIAQTVQAADHSRRSAILQAEVTKAGLDTTAVLH